MSEMQIRTFGQTAKQATATDTQIRDTQKLITKVRKQRTTGLENFICTWTEARQIADEIEAFAASTRLHNRADRIRSAGRLSRARVALAID